MKIRQFLLYGLLILTSCEYRQQNKDIASLLSELKGKEIIIPDSLCPMPPNTNITINPIESYGILNYIDSAGCLSCNLRLREWNIFLKELQDKQLQVSPIFIFSSNNKMKIKEIQTLAHNYNVTFPIIIDSLGLINKINKFPSNERLHTFLLNSDHKILAIGNPILNPKIKELFIRIMQENFEKEKDTILNTETILSTSSISLHNFNWQEEQDTSFTISNIGNRPLAIQEIITSCGCLATNYSQKPIPPNGKIAIQITYKADTPGYFKKHIKIYCNTENTPLQLTVSGEAI